MSHECVEGLCSDCIEEKLKTIDNRINYLYEKVRKLHGLDYREM